ncbi:glucose transporter type 1-like isoform X3 [Panonychus citri]|uniref:glucose transporter type 1-like isoform X3 n=1 Tax=Panonychus citri TaxID=50023 RepID=UPI0023076E96|nr:glucose transporter type 1-like isoform X3 [Panonychus citri]XP_053213493.1 glucose transporter type 1-like isoform X3 [Panonychus citri]
MCRPIWCPSGHHCPEGLTCMLMFAIFSAALGMFQFGYNTGVINAPQRIIEEFIDGVYKDRTGNYLSQELSDFLWSLTVSIFAVGGMFGGISGGLIADWCGRKCGLLLNNAIAILGATLMSSSQLFKSIECLIAGRFFIGLNCGISTTLVPMYLSEIAPISLRGALGTVSQLAVTIGLLLGQVLGIPYILGTKDGWPFLLGIAIIPAVLQLLLLPMCPESPRYLLISRGQLLDARFALQRLRCSTDVDEDIEEMRSEHKSQQSEKRYSVWQVISNKQFQKPITISIVMQLSQQLSGISAIFNYSTAIFKNTGINSEAAQFATIGVGTVMVIMTLVSIPLMDRAGRRTLQLWGLGGMFITSIFFTISLLVQFIYQGMAYACIVSALAFVIFFAMGPGSIPWLITAELFSQGPRSAAMSIAVLVNWSTNFVVGIGYLFMQNHLGDYTFLPFTAFLAIFWTFTYKKVPETKNRTFEEIQVLFQNNSGLAGMESIADRPTTSNVLDDKPNVEPCELTHFHQVPVNYTAGTSNTSEH